MTKKGQPHGKSSLGIVSLLATLDRALCRTRSFAIVTDAFLDSGVHWGPKEIGTRQFCLSDVAQTCTMNSVDALAGRRS
jgi:hypothetical protein